MSLSVSKDAVRCWEQRESRELIAAGGEDPATYMMQQDMPIGRPEHIELRNQHFQYAVIW